MYPISHPTPNVRPRPTPAPNPFSSPVLDPWNDAFNLWLASRPAENTRRAYLTAWQAFSSFTRKPPHLIGRADVSSWIDHLRTHGASPTTIRQRLAALSSFYTFTIQTYTTVDPAGREHPLHAFNPAAAVPHPKVTPYDKAIYLSPDEARAFLTAIPRHTLQGKRDYALFLAYLATGRRNSEIRLLRWRDLDASALPSKPSTQKNSTNGRVYYRWTGKGKQRRDECPLAVYHAILDYLQSSGRLRTIQPSDHIFTPLNNHASRLHASSHNRNTGLRHARTSNPSSPNPCNPSRQYSGAKSEVDSLHVLSTPLSSRSLNALVKKYASRAHLDPRRITVHTLRHTAAMLRKEAGDDLQSISAFLGHSTLAITQIYLHTVEGRRDTTWQKVEQILGIQTNSSLDSAPPRKPRLRRLHR